MKLSVSKCIPSFFCGQICKGSMTCFGNVVKIAFFCIEFLFLRNCANVLKGKFEQKPHLAPRVKKKKKKPASALNQVSGKEKSHFRCRQRTTVLCSTEFPGRESRFDKRHWRCLSSTKNSSARNFRFRFRLRNSVSAAKGRCCAEKASSPQTQHRSPFDDSKFMPQS